MFPSINHALRAEKLAAEAGLKPNLVPTPREIDADCGTSLKLLTWDSYKQTLGILHDAGLLFKGFARKSAGTFEAVEEISLDHPD